MKWRKLVSFSLVFLASTGARAADPNTFSMSDLMTLIDDSGTHSLQQLLPKLPDELLQNHTYMIASKSRQPGRRAILFRIPAASATSEIVAIAFKPDYSNPKRQRLEIMAYNSSPKPNETSLELYEVTFPPERGANGKVIPPVKNPETCTRCHGKDPRPIWGIYPQWPGSLGESDDELKDQKALASLKASPLGRLLHPLPESESPNSPYRPGGARSVDARFRPNLRLGFVLARLNAHRIAEHLRRSPSYRKYRSLILMTLLHCASPNSWEIRDYLRTEGVLPDEGVTKFLNVALAELARDRNVTFPRDSLTTLGPDVLGAFGLSQADVEMLSEQSADSANPVPATTWYFDGETRELFLLIGELLRDFPKETVSTLGRPGEAPYDYVLKYQQWKPWDWRKAFELGKPLDFQNLEKTSTCATLREQARREIFSSGENPRHGALQSTSHSR